MNRRGSFVAPLIVILLGLMFLLRNFWPAIPVGDIVAKYWPFLLIAWGGLRLLEILSSAMMRRPLPRNGISGGEWVLIVFLFIFFSGFHAVQRRHWFPDERAFRGFVVNMGENYDYGLNPVEKPSGKTPRIVIESFRGNARIMGADVDTVKVTGRKSIRSFQQAEADKANTNTPLELVAQGNDMIVRTNQDRVTDTLRVSNDLEITVPRGSSVQAHGRLGDFDITDISGSVDINSDNAGVRMQNIGGDVRVEVSKSDIVRASDLKGSLELKGHGNDVDFQNIAGQVTITGGFLGQLQFRNLAKPLRYEGDRVQFNVERLPGQIHTGPGEFTASNLVGPIRLSASSRDVQISDFTQSLDLNLDRGDIDLRPGTGTPAPKMDVRTRSGDIDLALPPTGKYDLKLTTDRGTAENEYGTPFTLEETDRGGTVNGTAGAGPQMRLETSRGKVSVRKSTGEGGEENVRVIPQPSKPPAAPLKPQEQ
ncbi:MAG TPA: DUF4097 family beta strand repeat-containing protein [Bryobacteraceae bacterium]|nr:DUF4097 family beta strand repeat-containing protein [Bryobacteraceae bacterium]